MAERSASDGVPLALVSGRAALVGARGAAGGATRRKLLVGKIPQIFNSM